MCGLQRATKEVKQRDPRHAARLCQCAPRAGRALLSTIRIAPGDVTCTVHVVGDKLPGSGYVYHAMQRLGLRAIPAIAPGPALNLNPASRYPRPAGPGPANSGCVGLLRRCQKELSSVRRMLRLSLKPKS
jgi:hypothetical protein